jgi:hypothetical protein
MTEPTPPNDNHDEHESYAGEPVPDPWERGEAGPEPDWHKGCSWCWRTAWHRDAPTGEEAAGGEEDGDVDSGSVPGQPQG